MSIGQVLLLAVLILLATGGMLYTQQALSLRTRPTLVFALVVLVSSFLPGLLLGRVQVGYAGALLALFCIGLFAGAMHTAARVRALACIVAVSLVMFIAGNRLRDEPEILFMAPSLFYGLCIGLASFIICGERRSACIGAIAGALLGDTILALIGMHNAPYPAQILGESALSSAMIAATLAVGLPSLTMRLRTGMRRRAYTHGEHA